MASTQKWQNSSHHREHQWRRSFSVDHLLDYFLSPCRVFDPGVAHHGHVDSERVGNFENAWNLCGVVGVNSYRQASRAHFNNGLQNLVLYAKQAIVSRLSQSCHGVSYLSNISCCLLCWPVMANVLLLAMMLAPAMYIDFRLQVGGIKVCTGASLKRGGLCYSFGLSAKGMAFTHSLASGREWNDCESLGLINIFAEIGASEDRLNCFTSLQLRTSFLGQTMTLQK